MSGAEIAQIITALGLLVTACFSGFAMIMSARAAKIGAANTTKIDEVHKLTNSLTERSNTAERAAGRAEGELTGRAAVKTEQGADALAREQPVTPPKV